MTITRTQLTQSNSATNTNAYDTGTVTPAANGLVVILLRTHYTTTGAPTITVTSNTGLNLTFSQIKQTDFTTIAAPTDTIAIYGALAGSTPGSGTIHVAISKTCSGLIWEVVQYGNVNTSGGTVASCIQQTGSGSSDTAGTTLTDTFGAAVNTNNAVASCGGQANKNGTLYTWNNSFTEDVDVGSGESTAYNLTTGHILSAFTGSSHTVTSTTSSIWGIIGAEIKASTGTTFNQTLAATTTVTAARVSQVNKFMSVTSSNTVVIQKQVSKFLSVSSTVTPAVNKLMFRTLAVSVSTALALLTQRVSLITLSVGTTVAVAMTKVVNKGLSVLSTIAVVLLKLSPKTLAVGSVATPNITETTIPAPSGGGDSDNRMRLKQDAGLF
ncbi:MAG TPA: hypothetical protein VJ508_13030 [Saprospiraceae bacterium]|nr:hypothetical protein [Saprospiraceae bacterium]